MAQPNRKLNYGNWSSEELRRAESTAGKFLQDHGSQISETFRAKMKCLEILVDRLNVQKTTLDERLDCFAQIAEISQMLKDQAEGFFELGSQPVVARVLANVRRKK
jgi:hypothetical protein